MTPQEVLSAAKQGNPQAIAALMNPHLQPKGITAKAKITDGCLHIMTEGVTVPNQAAIVPFITKGVRGLNVPAVKSLVVYGKVSGEEMPAWSDRVALGEAVAIELSTPLPSSIRHTSNPTVIKKMTVSERIGTSFISIFGGLGCGLLVLIIPIIGWILCPIIIIAGVLGGPFLMMTGEYEQIHNRLGNCPYCGKEVKTGFTTKEFKCDHCKEQIFVRQQHFHNF